MAPTSEDFHIPVADELTFTPFAGASLVNEILKGLLYQKCQIPYPYHWLKRVVEKRRQRLNDAEAPSRKVNFAHENHFRTVSKAYDHLDMVMRGISKEFCDQNSEVQEVVVMFGPSPACIKEAFTIALPGTLKGHVEHNHIGQLNKNLQKVLRKVFLSQSWIDSIDTSIPCTNTYIYLKKLVKGRINMESDTFETCQAPHLSSTVKHSRFHISYQPTETGNCTCNFNIFSEGSASTELVTLQTQDSEGLDEVVWYRIKGLLKGFRDSFINKVSICELW